MRLRPALTGKPKGGSITREKWRCGRYYALCTFSYRPKSKTLT